MKTITLTDKQTQVVLSALREHRMEVEVNQGDGDGALDIAVNGSEWLRRFPGLEIAVDKIEAAESFEYVPTQEDAYAREQAFIADSRTDDRFAPR